MENQFTDSDEIIAIKSDNFYPENFYPEKVLNEGDSLNSGTRIHNFYWRYNGPNYTADYEPVAVDRKNKFVLTRFHDRGLFLWVNYKNENTKPVVGFFTPYHTPMLCTEHLPHVMNEPTRFEDRFAYKALALAYFFPRNLSRAITKSGKYRIKKYYNILSPEIVREDKRFRWERLRYVVIIGPRGALNNLDIPEALRNQLDMIINSAA